jgi:hypothetical protein
MTMKLIRLLTCLDCPHCRYPRDAFEGWYCRKLHQFMDEPIISPYCPLEDAPR